jgi:hypothetical protein
MFPRLRSRTKFLAMTTMVIDRAHAQRISDLVMSLDRQAKADIVPRTAVATGVPSLRAA